MTHLPAKTDIVILGAGVMGASIAYHLAQKSDLSVTVLDQTGPLGGMSGRTFGQVRLHYSNALTLDMARYGIETFASWDARVGLGSSGYVPMGYLLTAKQEQIEAAQRNVDLARSLGIETEMVGPDRIAEIEPAINPDGLVAAAWDPAGGYIDITRITLSWLAAADLTGRVKVHRAKALAVETSNGAVSGVQTDIGAIKADCVISAIGPWSTPLLEPLGLTVPIEARRLDTMYMRLPFGAANLRTCVTDGTSNIVVRPDMGPTLLAAAYPPHMDLVDDPIVSPTKSSEDAHFGRIERAFAERFPSLSGATPLRSVSGSYDITPDWHPILGPVKTLPGLHLACGFSGHGLKLAPAVGVAIAESVLGKPRTFDISPLRHERFAENEPMYLAYGPGGRA